MNLRHLPPAVVAALLIAFAVLRIVLTYRTFSATADEATHVGAGLELYQFHRYQLQRINPPISRAVLGIAPGLGGMRFDPRGDFGYQLHSVFYGAGRYEQNLFLGRVGNLVFLILAAVALFFCTRQETDDFTATIAVFLFTFEPVILGHAGLATNDAAATAGLALALLAFTRWLQKPAWSRAAVLGLAWTFAVLCKFSNLAFVPLACFAIVAVRLIHDRENRRAILRGAVTLLVIPLMMPVAIWAGYAFSIGKLGDLSEMRDAFGPRVEQMIVAHPSAPLPASGFFYGIANITLIDRVGHLSYFRGVASMKGWPLYFPATILLKTTLAILPLIVVSAFFTRQMPRLRWLLVESAAAAIVILAFSSKSQLDLGIRYVLPVFVPLTMAAAAGATAMLRSRRAAMIGTTLVLIGHGAASLAAHPDYFPYFNALAGRDPSRYLIDSNLDWGQDVLRLRKELRRQHADRVGVFIMGSPDYDALGFPPHYDLDPFHPAGGWIAVSDHVYRMEAALSGGWRWLSGAKFIRVGKSIRLFHFAPGAFADGFPARESAFVLLPIAGTSGDVGGPSGPRWHIRQLVTNTGKEPVHIETNACVQTSSCAFDLSAAQTVAIAASWPRTQYVILRTKPGQADRLRSSTVLERTDAQGHGFKVPIPSVREEQFESGSVVVRDVPVSPRLRLNLRMWALNSSGAARYTVKVISGGATIAERPFATGPDGFVTDPNLAGEFRELAGRELRADFVITRDAGDDSRLWAFITATDNGTNLPQLLFPSK